MHSYHAEWPCSSMLPFYSSSYIDTYILCLPCDRDTGNSASVRSKATVVNLSIFGPGYFEIQLHEISIKTAHAEDVLRKGWAQS